MYTIIDKLIYIYYFIKGKFCKSFNNKYDRIVLDDKDSQTLICNKIKSGEPFVVSRFGSVELNAIVKYIGYDMRLFGINEKAKKMLNNNAGFFPNNNECYIDFCKYMLSIIGEIDVLNCFGWHMENYMVINHMKKTKLASMITVEPYYFSNNWAQYLKGKKVLVIHPFTETIEKQYKKRKMLFKKEVLPEFDLITLKAVQSIGGIGEKTGFASWFDALSYMHDEIKKIDYDIALVGCGAYGMPLSIMIKNDGKQAIHMGGALQILFGIKGERWNNIPSIKNLYNKYWCKPSENEKPKEYNKIENGCYW